MPNGSRDSGGGGHFAAPGGARQDNFPDVDLPATPDVGGADGGMRFIDEAMEQMSADDMPLEPQEPQTQPPAPRYPEPVQPQPAQRQPAVARPGQAKQPQVQPGRQPPVATPAPAAPAAPTEAEQAQQKAEKDPFGLQADLLEQQMDTVVGNLAQQVYGIADADMDAFLSGDGTKVSQALARVHVNAVGSVMRVISQQMPIWVGNMLKYHQTAVERENGFWEANPHLSRAEHAKIAKTAATTYMQAFPQTTLPEAYKAIGAMVAAALGIQAVAGQYTAPNGARTPGRVVRNVPQAFTPAGTEGTRAPQVRETNPWSQMTDIMLADDAGMFDTR